MVLHIQISFINRYWSNAKKDWSFSYNCLQVWSTSLGPETTVTFYMFDDGVTWGCIIAVGLGDSRSEIES